VALWIITSSHIRSPAVGVNGALVTEVAPIAGVDQMPWLCVNPASDCNPEFVGGADQLMLSNEPVNPDETATAKRTRTTAVRVSIRQLIGSP
jgi:hypothetical protein